MGTRRSVILAGLVALLAPTVGAAQQQMSDRAEAAADAEIDRRTRMIVPGIEDFRFASTSEGDRIWLDVVWVGRNLDKIATEVRGSLLFYDMAGRLRFGLQVDLQQPIRQSQAITQTGIGIAYDDSRADHRWLRTTPTSAMRIDFRVARVMFEDGELLEFSPRR